tara:strand:- start:1527 stop:1736 length:210 start_codon:yes stop_codon:yes gene_type:complete
MKVIRNIAAKDRAEYAYLGDAIVYDGASFKQDDMHKAALKAAAADRSNPFAYVRAMKDMKYGYTCPELY